MTPVHFALWCFPTLADFDAITDTGELTAVWVPDSGHEAMRDLVRARATAAKVLSKARQHLNGFLLRPASFIRVLGAERKPIGAG
jgi:hypothetical protein